MSLRDLLVCPACRSALEWRGDTAHCSPCGADYPVLDGIPHLVGGIDQVKAAQAAWFDSEVDEEYEIERPHGTPRFHAWLLEEKFRRSVDAIRPRLTRTTVAVVCAGSGMDAEFVARAGARVLAFDISPGAAGRAAERARRRGLEIVPVVADAERLPLADSAVDMAYVHDGLHHLERPLAGLSEMARVARGAVSVTEPARAAATALSVRIGYSGSVEEAGNRVERLRPEEVASVLEEHGFEIARSRRYAMVYRHEAGRPVRLASRPGLFNAARLGFRAANSVLGSVGNKLAVQAIRPANRRIAVHDFAGHPFQIQLSRELARRGDAVVHLYCPSYPNGRGRMEPLPDDPLTLSVEPVQLPAELRKYSLLGRPLDELRYGRQLRRRLRAFGPEVVISSNAPLLVQAAALRESRLLSSAFVFWQQDMHGLAMQRIARYRLGPLGAPLGSFFPRLEGRLLRRSDMVVPISESFLEPLARWRVPPERVRLIENWGPVEELRPAPRDNSWRREHRLGDRRVLLYTGTLGLKHDPGLLYELARRVEPVGGCVVVVSEGSGASALRSRLEREPLPSLLLLPFQPYERLAETMGAADVLVALLSRHLGSYAVPSKVLTYLCAGRPLLAAIPAENPAAAAIVRAGAGIVVEPEETEEFFAAALRLLADNAGREAMGGRARTYAEETFPIASVANAFEAAIELALRAKRARMGETRRDLDLRASKT